MKHIVIIGASAGMGRAVAEAFARGGWRVGVTARREEPLRQLAQQYPDRVVYSAFDAAQDDATSRFYDLIEDLGGMDILLYAAGSGWFNPQLDTTMEMTTIESLVKGFTRIVTAAFKYYERTANVSRGRIAAITSVAGVKGMGISPAYSAAKRYQWNYLQALDQLAHERHVNVGITDIRPGFVKTALLDNSPANLPMTMSLDYATARIVRALLRGPRVAYIDSRWHIVATLWRLLPNAIWPHLSFNLR